MFIFYVSKREERYVSRSFVLKDDYTFIIFTSFLDVCLMYVECLILYNFHLYELVKIDIMLLSFDYWFERENYSS